MGDPHVPGTVSSPAVAVIECVPNVSEGRRAGVIDRLTRAIEAPDVRLLDVSSDPSHHRTVFTMVGEPPALKRAVLALFEAAIAAIDLRAHQGIHPRVGAVDVVPFVPLPGSSPASSMLECIAPSRVVAQEVASRFDIPTFLYEDAAFDQTRRRLEQIRRGGFEQLATRLATPAWRPDFGPPAPHPTAGASAIGARGMLIAWNLLLSTGDVAVAREVARAIRESGGGLPAVKAMGLLLAHRALAQISMNLTDYRVTPMHEVWQRVADEARARGASIVESEIVGLVPREALATARPFVPQLWSWHQGRILEERL
jgi:glutamate formiminotransferase